MKRLAAFAFALLAPLLASAQYNSYTNYAPGTAPSYEGLWWNASESGWGVSIAHQGDNLFVVWYTFDRGGQPTWFAMPDVRLMNDNMGDMTGMGDMEMMMGMPLNPPIFTGAIYRPSMAAGKLVMTYVGDGTVMFKDRSRAVFAYTVNGFSGSKDISRMVYSSAPQTCTLGGAKGTTDNYQGLWYDPVHNGHGVNIVHQGNTVFATYYTYDASGAPTWYAASNTDKYDAGADFAAAFDGPLLRATGSPYDAAWDASKASVAQVGSVSLMFGRNSTGGLFLPHTSETNFPALTETMIRMQFAAPASVCR